MKNKNHNKNNRRDNSSNTKINTVLLATGGTGGHLFPALVVRNELVEKYNTTCVFVSDNRLVKLIPKSLTDKILYISPPKNIKKLFFSFKLPVSLFQIIKFIIKNKVNKIICFGGYATFPIVIAAFLLHKKIYLHEQNAYIGRVNKFALYIAKKLFVSYQETHGIPHGLQKKICFSGLPIRSDAIRLDKQTQNSKKKQNITQNKKYIVEKQLLMLLKKHGLKNNYQYQNKKIVLIIGGSQGTRLFNKLVPQTLTKFDYLTRSRDLLVIHQARTEDVNKVQNLYKEQNIDAIVSNFFDNMALLFDVANVIISRAGSSMVHEVIYNRKLAIFIPMLYSMSNHQFFNAKYFADKNLCYLLTENQAEPNRLYKMIYRILYDSNYVTDKINNLQQMKITRPENTIAKLLVA